MKWALKSPFHVKKNDCVKSRSSQQMFDRNNNSRGFAPREMVKGNWKCSECGTEITELPFEPAPDRPIYCRECWSKKRPPRFSR
jgi:CxxC-x17-CxxC domain-containing protein